MGTNSTDPATGSAARLPIDQAIDAAALVAVPAWDLARRRAILDRMGFGGPLIPTLEETGQRLGLTRERVRQLQVKLRTRLKRVFSPKVSVAVLVAELDSARPTAAGPIDHLVSAGLLSRPIAVEGLQLVGTLAGMEAELNRALSRWTSLGRAVKKAAATARAMCRSVGMTHTEWVTSVTAQDVGQINDLLRHDPSFVDLGEGWFRERTWPTGRNRLVNVTWRMLCVAQRLSIADALEGLERALRWRGVEWLPSQDGLRRFYESSELFTVVDGTVSSSIDLPRSEYLDGTERILTDILLADPDGVMGREELRTKALEAGINVNTFSVYTSYSPVIKHVGLDVWTYRGNRPSPAVVALYVRSRRANSLSYEWSSSGHLIVRYVLPSEESTVVAFPVAIRRYVADRTFALVNDAKERCGTVRVDPTGTSWGYGPLVQPARGRKGDVLVLDIDLTSAEIQAALQR